MRFVSTTTAAGCFSPFGDQPQWSCYVAQRGRPWAMELRVCSLLCDSSEGWSKAVGRVAAGFPTRHLCISSMDCVSGCVEEAGVELLPKDSPPRYHPLNTLHKTGCRTGSCSHNSNSVFLKQVYNFTSSASLSLICCMFALVALCCISVLLWLPCCFTVIIMRYNRCDKLPNCFWSKLFPLHDGVLASFYSYTHKRGISTWPKLSVNK